MAKVELELAHFIDDINGDSGARIWIRWEAFRGPRERSNAVQLIWLDGQLVDERTWRPR